MGNWILFERRIYRIAFWNYRQFERLNNENNEKSATTQIIKVITKKLETIFNENKISHVKYLSIYVKCDVF